MDILGNRRFVEVPGGKTHQLPPLLVNAAPKVRRLDRVMNMAEKLVELDDIRLRADAALPELDADRRKMDLAINVVDKYLTFVAQWQWGDSIREWIRQCETTFDSRAELRNLLRSDVWPHAGRCSFVQLLEDKFVDTDGVSLERAVGLRLAFDHPPSLSALSDHFLFYLGPDMAMAAFQNWAQLSAPPISSLPPERFAFEVINMAIQ